MPLAEPERVAAQMRSALGAEDILHISAKTGLGIPTLLAALLERVPAPTGQPAGPLRALLLDASWDAYRGAVCVVKVVDGELRTGDRIESAATGESAEVLEVGLLAPEPLKSGALKSGHVGYVITSSRSLTAARVGDTLRLVGSRAELLPGFKPAKAMLFQGLFPATADQYEVRAQVPCGARLTPVLPGWAERTRACSRAPGRRSRLPWSG
jgi:translation elongation factor EF-4